MHANQKISIIQMETNIQIQFNNPQKSAINHCIQIG